MVFFIYYMIMIIRNPREQKFAWLQSTVTSDFVEPAQPKMRQTHSDRVMIVVSYDQDIGEADGMVTNLKDLELQVRVADCGNIYAYDPVWGVIGICHSGWKWSHMNIIQNMIDAIYSLWSDPQDIRIRTGPCISGENYQFWPEVKELFEEKYYTVICHCERNVMERGNPLIDCFVPRNDVTKNYYLNLPALHRDQLLWAWILAKHIIQSDICTFEDLSLPSYRRDGADSGRITGVIQLLDY